MSEMMNIAVTVDPNDADYITQILEISKAELDKIRPLIEAIKNFKPYKSEYKGYGGATCNYTHHCNYPYGDCVREDLGEKSPREIYPDIDDEVFDAFECFVPYTEYGFHTVHKVEVWPMVEKEILL